MSATRILDAKSCRSVAGPKMTMNGEVWWKTERPLSATLQQISTTSQN
jgi:hypothetical protein